jgi:hypothetical protein
MRKLFEAVGSYKMQNLPLEIRTVTHFMGLNAKLHTKPRLSINL